MQILSTPLNWRIVSFKYSPDDGINLYEYLETFNVIIAIKFFLKKSQTMGTECMQIHFIFPLSFSIQSFGSNTLQS